MNESTMQIIKELDGKAVNVNKMSITANELSLIIIIELNHHNRVTKLLFENVHDVRMDFDNSIFLECFEIIDNSLRGWDKSRRYLIHDVESDSLSFYCENIELA